MRGGHLCWAAACVVLAGCSTPNTALELLREQQQAQMAIQEQEARHQQANAATEDQLYLTSIRRMQDEGRHFAALAHLSAYEQRFGGSPELTLMRADALRATGQRAESEAIYRSLLAQAPSAAAWRGLGLLAGSAGDYPGAAEALARAAALAPTHVQILSDLGYARLRAGLVEQARLPLAQAAELAPENTRILANFALLLAVQGDMERADAVMLRAGLSEQARDAVRVMAVEMRERPVAVAAVIPVATGQPGVPLERPVVLNRARSAEVVPPERATPATGTPTVPQAPDRLPVSDFAFEPNRSLFDRLAANP